MACAQPPAFLVDAGGFLRAPLILARPAASCLTLQLLAVQYVQEAEEKHMKYPRFATTLRDLAPTLREIAMRIGRSERQASYYLTGNAMPTADITIRIPMLHTALRHDLGFHELVTAEASDPGLLLIAA